MNTPAPPPQPFGDLVQPFQIEDLGLRGRLVRLGDCLDDAFARHGYPEPVAGLLAETMTLCVVLASALKFDGVFGLQAQGDGPVALLAADLTSDGEVRGFAKFDGERVDATAAAGAVVPRLLGAGHLAFTVDQGPDTERYQGITELQGATIAECAQTYFRQSEQLETAILLTARPAGDGARAAGLMIQRLPGGGEGTPERDDDDEAWRRAVILLGSITGGELLDAALAPADLLYRLYHEDGVRLFRQRPVRHACRCSRRRVARTLASFPQAEVEAMAEAGRVTVTCEFCLAEYGFDEAERRALFAVGAA